MQKFPGYSFLIDFFPTFETARSSRTLRKALAKRREAPAHCGRLSQNREKLPHTAEGSRNTAGKFRTPRKAPAKRREGSAHRGRFPQNGEKVPHTAEGSRKTEVLRKTVIHF